MAASKPAKRDDGIIRVVQGAAGSSSGTTKPAVATTTTMRNPTPPPGSGTRKQAAAVNSRPGEWADPFSDGPSRKGGKQVAAKRQVVQAEEEDDVRPPTRRAAAVAPPPTVKREASRGSNAGDWANPFSDGDRKSTGTRRAAPPASGKSSKSSERPAHPAGWKDPFTSDDAPAAKPSRTVVATREPVKHDTKKLSVTPTATHRVAAAPAEAPAPAQGRWGVLKKRR